MFFFLPQDNNQIFFYYAIFTIILHHVSLKTAAITWEFDTMANLNEKPIAYFLSCS